MLRPAFEPHPSLRAPLAALLLYALWAFATWFLEGRVETLLRPEATSDRAIYAVVANITVGTGLALLLLHALVRGGAMKLKASGFGAGVPSLLKLAIAFLLGFGLYGLQGAPSLNPAVLINAFSQVLVVSVAEVIVCWALVGASLEAALRGRLRLPWLAAAVTASILFGLYHLAHSAPFNSLPMVFLLTAVGFVTSAFFFATRDVYATIVFHNFLGMFGVVQALAARGGLETLAAPQWHLIVTAAAALAVVGLLDWRLLRKL